MLKYFVIFSIFYFLYSSLRFTIYITYTPTRKEDWDKQIEAEIVRTIEFMIFGLFLYYAYQHNLFDIKEWFFTSKFY